MKRLSVYFDADRTAAGKPSDAARGFRIRHADECDAKQLAAVERSCFPAAEAATREEITERVRSYGDHFWVGVKDGKIVSFVDGMVTDLPDLTDEMLEKAKMHNPAGKWQMIFGVNTIQEERRNGFAGRLLDEVIRQSKREGRRGVVLTCKKRLISYYAKFGFRSEGISASVHGSAVWYQMRLTF